MTPSFSLWVTAFALLMNLACASVESTDVRTSGVYASFEAKADGDGSTALSASLTVGTNSTTYLDLVSGDTLNATFDGDTKTMERSNLGSMVWYTTSFLTDVEGSEFNIAFDRDSDDNAPNSAATLPAPFEITVPTEGDTFSMAADKIDIAWNSSGTDDEMHVMLSGDCFYGQNITVDGDPGVYIIEAGILEPISDTDTCTGTLTLTRKRMGTVDNTYGEGGEFRALQVRNITINLQP